MVTTWWQQVFGNGECIPWLVAGGLGHIIFDVLTYAAVFVFGAKLGKKLACKHSHRKEIV